MPQFSPELDHLLRERMATGRYVSEEAALIEGVRLLADRDDTLAAVARGYASIELGEGIPVADAFAEIRQRHNLSPGP